MYKPSTSFALEQEKEKDEKEKEKIEEMNEIEMEKEKQKEIKKQIKHENELKKKHKWKHLFVNNYGKDILEMGYRELSDHKTLGSCPKGIFNYHSIFIIFYLILSLIYLIFYNLCYVVLI